MTTNAALERVESPLQDVSPVDAATIIRTLGALLIDAYSAVGPTSQEEEVNVWGSKQRELLLRALLARVAVHARTFENAALSATEAALITFARDEFKKDGGTRSHRDRKPITKNLDKVVGGWLRRLGRKLRQNIVIVSMSGAVDLRDRRGLFRLTVTFSYPWRLVRDRRLRITARIEELQSGVPAQTLRFPSDATADAVALPEARRRYTPDEARVVAAMFGTMKDVAELVHDPELAEYAQRGLTTFVPSHLRKAVLMLVLVVALGAAAASPPGRRFVARVVDAIVSSGSLRELLERLRVNPEEGVFVAPSGAQSQVARSGSGSEIRMSPGSSPELLHIEASVSGKDFSELTAQMVALGDMGRLGVNAFQFRSAPEEPILPWIVEVAVIPEQDRELAAELARQQASVSITYEPPLGKADLTRVHNISQSGKRATLVSELRELPHKRQSYAITATLRREVGTSQVYRAHLRVDENGFATLERDRGRALTAVTQDVKVGHPICTTIVPSEMLPMGNPGQTDYLWALAKPFEEQEAILIVYPLSSNPEVNEITVDWGDGSKGTRELEKGVFTPTHTYRVGDRAYPITIYFKGTDVVYTFDLYVFRSRPSVQGGTVLDYVTPYPPNPELTDLVQVAPDESGGMAARMRPGPVKTDSITYSRHRDPWVWNVPMDWRTADRLQVRYFWRRGEIIELPAVER